MRLTLVTETYPPQINGVSRTLERLVTYLLARGDRVQLLLPRYQELPAPHPFLDAVSIPAVPLPFYKEVVLPLARPATLRRHLQRFNPDLVHIATEGPLGRSALQAAHGLALPAVSSYHTNFSHYLRLYHLGCLEGISWRYLRRFHNATRLTFCPTPSIRELLADRGFANLRTWGRGVDGERFHPGKRQPDLRRGWGVGPADPVAVYAGRLAAEKNLEMLLAAWRQVPGRNCRLLLVGDGPLRHKLEGENDGRVVFAGYRQGEELAQAYASADLLVFPSLTETFGNVILEAMASGLPAVGFRVPGPQDIVREGETGVLAAGIGAEELARAVTPLLLDGERRREMGKKARAHAENQSWPAILGRLREDYFDALPAPGRENHRDPVSLERRFAKN